MTHKPFLALITPIGDAGPPLGGGGGGQPPYPSTGPGFPTNPIARPPWGWGSGNPPPGWSPPYVDIGFPGNQPYPDQSLPGPQPHPSHPIYYPPVIWDPSRPSNPIVNPGDPNQPGAGQPEGDRTPKIEWKTAWSPTTGWIVVGVPTGEHVTPSSEKPPETPPA